MLFRPRRRRKAQIFLFLCLLFVGGGVYWYQHLFGAPAREGETVQFVVPYGGRSEAISRLREEGFIRNEWAFAYALARTGGDIDPGGYRLSKTMDAWEVARVMSDDPYAIWITIPEGKRKEEIASLLATALQWSDEARTHWIEVDTAPDQAHMEGVYFPDTYLIPRDEPPAETAKRLRARFDEAFAPYAEEAIAQNIKWDTVVKIASLLEREAAGSHDMPLIAGIIWNRLLTGMRLEIDATLQYARGDTGAGWWAPITPADKQFISPFNTYKNKGLPPHPIANPGIAAIKAALFPEETDCVFYLHDRLRRIHCAVTYQEHLQNIEQHLR